MLILDAYNILHAVGGVESQLGNLSLEQLCVLIEGVPGIASQGVWIVCDGSSGKSRVDEGRTRSDAQVRVMFAGPGKDADSMIERVLDELEHAGRVATCVVVSSDKRVQAAAVGVRCKRMSSEAFIRLLLKGYARADLINRLATGNKPEQANRSGLDAATTDFWLRQFDVDAADPGLPREGSKSKTSPTAGSKLGSPPTTPEDDWPEGIDPADLDMGKWLGESRKEP